MRFRGKFMDIKTGLPWIRRNIIEPVHSIKNHNTKLRYWRELEKTQYLPENTLRDLQWQRFEAILRYAYENNDFYRRRFDAAGILPNDIRTPDDVKHIPVLTKKEIRRNTVDMISMGYTIDKLLKAKTGGSTGKALEIFVSVECNEMRNACARRHDRWTGWEVGEPIAAVWGNPKLPRNIKGKLKDCLLFPFIYLDTMNVTEETVLRFAHQWQRERPTLLFGHAHSLYLLARHVRDLKISSIHPKNILSTSMMLLPNERKTIEQVFGVDVFDRYGCEEVGLIASECEEHGGMHMNIEHLLIEFVKDDGTYASPGEAGQIILTDLMNYAMPFIRYQVEDIGVPLEGTCTCGRGLPLMDTVAGRVADFLLKKDGSKVAGLSLIENTLTKVGGIDQMQIIQESLDLIRLKIVFAQHDKQRIHDYLYNYFAELFGYDTEIRIEEVDQIKPDKSGKYRFSICKIHNVN